MATIKKYNDGTVFYDAFGGKIGETTVEEEWMGDRFNRDALMCYTTADCATSTDSKEYGTVNGIDSKPYSFTASIEPSDLASLRGSIGISDVIHADVEPLRTAIDELQIRCDMLQAQIDAAKERATYTTKLRPALKTLQYKSEVE
jgi:hypothetical protein